MKFSKTMILGGALLAQCAVGQSANAQGYFINPFEERPIGQRAHPKFVAEKGGLYKNVALSNYVRKLGGNVARTSARFPHKIVFSVVDNSDLQAVTVIGGYIYVYTGALVWINDEAELAALIGHELGHAIKRHSARKHNRSNVAGSFLRLASLRRRNPERLKTLQVKAALAKVSYSQELEYEADNIGFNVNEKMGLDAYGSARMLFQLELRKRLIKKQLGAAHKESPAYLQSHPQSIDRARKAANLAKKSRYTDLPKYKDRYLSMVNGLRLKYRINGRVRNATLRVHTVSATNTARVLASKMIFPSHKLDYFLAINGFTDVSQVKPGMKVKVVS
ncbi:M48 family metalloprotease [Parasphingorhabdus flavimaris]|uniref:M48 family metalloprotease n=1 Tax=Parasphingorhabdus flavimaris TaxID=266812 RepID=UPI0030035AE2